MRIAVTGATGTIGRALVRALLGRGDDVVALSRDPYRAASALGDGVEAVAWPEPTLAPAPIAGIRGSDAVVNLMGAPVSQRWSRAAKRAIRDSRVIGTRNLVEALGEVEPRPWVLLSGSASGYYGRRGDEPVEESSAPGGDFLADVTRDWEREAESARELGLRVATMRTGVVLSDSGGALEKMLPFFKLGIGGPVAGGRQYVPWVHLDDVVGAFLRCLDDESGSGPVNVTAPEPATNTELSKALGRALRRPAVAPVPAFAVKLLYGEMASIVTTGVRAVPRRLLDLGYPFEHPDLDEALRSVTGR